MKRTTLWLTGLVLALVCLAPAQTAVNKGRFYASDYNYRLNLKTGTSASGAGSFTMPQPTILVNGKEVAPFSTSNSVATFDGASAETITITSVSGCSSGSANCIVSFSSSTNAHGGGTNVGSGTSGFGEAVTDAKATGGVVVIDSSFLGSTSTITGYAGGAFNVAVEDIRGSGSPTVYSWTGSAYKATALPLSSANGAMFVPFVNEELLTLSTGGTTTDTAGNLLPASSIILGVSGRVGTTITAGCTGWALGDATTAARWTASNTTLTAGTVSPGTTLIGSGATTGIASATTGVWQQAAAKVRVTCATAAPGAGAVRISVFGFTLIPATQ